MVVFGSALNLGFSSSLLGLSSRPKGLGLSDLSDLSLTASLAWLAISETVSAGASNDAAASSDVSAGFVSVLLKRLKAEITTLWLRTAKGVDEGTAERTMADCAETARNAALLMKCLWF